MFFPWEDPEWGKLPDADRVLIFNEYMKDDEEGRALPPEDRSIIRSQLGAGAIERAAGGGNFLEGPLSVFANVAERAWMRGSAEFPRLAGAALKASDLLQRGMRAKAGVPGVPLINTAKAQRVLENIARTTEEAGPIPFEPRTRGEKWAAALGGAAGGALP